MTGLSDLTLIINAGGQSRRMGQPKALLPVPPRGEPLIAHIARRLQVLAPTRWVVVTNDPDLPAHAGLPAEAHFVGDAYPDTGTLGGIATGLRWTRAWAIVVACDLPLVNAALFAHLCGLATEQDNGQERWDAIVPVVNGYEEPLHALYHRRCLEAIESRLAAGQRRVVSFMPAVRTRYVPEAELRLVDPALNSFLNTNTPEEWAHALALLPEA
jgi:molybdopterin-guanine dinucleotide biosynthesis protein A